MDIDWNNVYPESTRPDLRDLENQNCQIIQNYRFSTNFLTDFDNYGPNIYSGINTNSNANVVIQKLHLQNELEARMIQNNLKQCYKFKHQNITSVLPIHSHEDSDNHIYLIYKFYKCSLRKYLTEESFKSEENFKILLRNLFKAIDLIHEDQTVLGNISLNSFVVQEENRKLEPKLVNLSNARKSTDIKDYIKDRRDVAVLILSMFIDEQEARIIADEFEGLETRDAKFTRIYDQVVDVQWISRSNIKNFADLIACLLNVKPRDNLKAFGSHPFFYSRLETLEFLSAVNGRLNLSQDDRNKNSPKIEYVKDRNKVLNKIMPGNPEIHAKLKEFLDDFAPKDATLAERSREARNKEVHLEDDTDIEYENEDTNGYPQESENNCNGNAETRSLQAGGYAGGSTTSVNNQDPQNSTGCKTKTNAKKDPKAWEKMSRFLRKKGGAIKVHLEADENFIYDLFNSLRILAFNPNIRRFYIDSFLFDEPPYTSRYNKVLADIKAAEKLLKDADVPNPTLMNTGNTVTTSKLPPSRSAGETNQRLVQREKKLNAGSKNQKENRPEQQHVGISRPQTRDPWHGSRRSISYNHPMDQIQLSQPTNMHYQQHAFIPISTQQPQEFIHPQPGPSRLSTNSNDFIPGRPQHPSAHAQPHVVLQNQRNNQQPFSHHQFAASTQQPVSSNQSTSGFSRNAPNFNPSAPGFGQYNSDYNQAGSNSYEQTRGNRQHSERDERNKFLAKHYKK